MGYSADRRKELGIGTGETLSYSQRRRKELETEDLAKQKGTTVDGLERAKYANQENARKEQKLKELNTPISPEQEADTAIQKIKDKPWYVPKGVAVSIENVKLSPKARKIYADKSEEKKSKSANRAVGNAFVDSATLGALSTAEKVTHEKYGIGTDKFLKQKAENKANHPAATTIGTVGGYLLPGAGVENVAGKALKPLLGKVGSKVAQKAITGAVTGGGMELAEGAIRGQSAKDIAKRTAIGAGFGAAGDVAFYGAGKGISSIANKIKAGKVLTTAEKEIVKNTPELLPKLAKETPLPTIDANLPTNTISKPVDIMAYKNLAPKLNPTTPILKKPIVSKSIDIKQSLNRINDTLSNSFKFADHQKKNISSSFETMINDMNSSLKKGEKKISDSAFETFDKIVSDMIDIQKKTKVPNVEAQESLKTYKEFADYFQNRKINYDYVHFGADVAEKMKSNGHFSSTSGTNLDAIWDEAVANTGGVLNESNFGFSTGTTEGKYRALLQTFDEVKAAKNASKSLRELSEYEIADMIKNTSDEAMKVFRELGQEFKNIAEAKKDLPPSLLRGRLNIPNTIVAEKKIPIIPTLKYKPEPSLKTDLPKPSTQTSQFRTNTLERSTMLPDAVKKDLNPKEFDYIVESSKDWQSQAMKNVADNKEKVMSDIINANSISGGIQAHEVAAITSNLLDEVRKTSDTSTFKSWLKIVTEKTRETARALKGTDTAWDKKTAEGALTDAQRVIDKVENGIEKSNPAKIKKINEETARRVKEFTDLGKTVNPDEIRDIVKKEYGVPTLDDSDIKFIIDNMDKAKSLEDGSYEQRVLHAKVAKIIADKIPSSFGEKFQASQRILMLLNTKTTVVRNPLGNALLGTLEDAKNIIATPIDKMVSGIRKSERTTTLSPLLKSKASIDGAKKGLKEWALDIKNGIDTSPTGGQVEMPKNKIFSENHNIGNASIKSVADTGGKVANKVHGVVGKMLQIGDRPFYEAAYGSRIAELKKIRNTDIITDAMKEDAVQYAFERTLQNDSALAQMFTGLKKGSFISDEHSAAKSVYQFMANLVMPFTKTPANILDKFIDYSPVGILKASTVHGLATVGKGTFNQKKFVDTMARGLTGTGLSTLGYLMAQKGLITGARDNNNKVEKIETALGKQNYAFKVGDNYYTYDWALPASAPIAMGADIYNAIAKSDGKNAVLKGTESAVNLLFNSTLLQGPSGFTGGYSPAAALGRGLMGTTTQATPTAGKQIAQLIDPYIRETYDPNTFKQTLNKTIARIPFASKTLPAKVDVFGNDVKAFQGKNNVWNVMFNPGFSTTYKPDDVQKEIIRLYSDSGLTEQLPTLADKYIAETKQNPRINLTSDEFVQYQKQIGQLTASRFKEVINSLEYRNGSLSDEIKAKMLGDIVKDSKRQAKNNILVKKGYQAR